MYGIHMKAQSNEAPDQFKTMGQVIQEVKRTKPKNIEMVAMGQSPQNLLDLLMFKLIWSVAPILNTDCKLDSLSQKSRAKFTGQPMAAHMGLCFNNDIYNYLSKGLLHPDILEMISN